MPHFIVEYSANVEAIVDLPALAAQLRDVAVETGVFPLAGVRVRMHRCEIYEIADGDSRHGFIHLMLRVGAGRDLKTLQTAAQTIFDFLTGYLTEIHRDHPLALSFEIIEIDKVLTFKKNSIRDYLST